MQVIENMNLKLLPFPAYLKIFEKHHNIFRTLGDSAPQALFAIY